MCLVACRKRGYAFFFMGYKTQKNIFFTPWFTTEKKMSKIYPTVVVRHAGHSTPHKIYRFENDYGASVVEHNDSYGVELALIKFVENGEWELVYNEDFPDVEGWCNEETIQEHLQKIKNY